MAVWAKSGLFLANVLWLVAHSVQQTTEVPEICNRTLDLVFVIDGSNSVGSAVFTDTMQNVSKAVDVLAISESDARVGAVLYSSVVTQVLQLQTDKEAFQTAVTNFEYPDEATYTNLGIDKAVEILMADGRRNNTPITMMIVTDGEASDKQAAFHSALVARSKGIDVWAIGVGNLTNMQDLADIATNGINQTFMIESYQILAARLLNLTREVCNRTETRPTFEIPTTTPSLGTASTDNLASTTQESTSSTSTTAAATTTTLTSTTASSISTTAAESTSTTAASISTTTAVTTTAAAAESTSTTAASISTTAAVTTTLAAESTSTTAVSISTTAAAESTSTTVASISTTAAAVTTTETTTTATTLESTTIGRTIESTPRPGESTSEDGSDSLNELCKSSLTVGGVGYVLYPQDCTKVLQCYYNPNTNKTLVVTRQCPSGQFWNQACLKCDDSWKVDCPYDKCKTNSCSGGCPAVDTYPMDGVCGGFWSCQEGRSYSKCCPPCYSYMPGYGCKFSTTCMDKCGTEEQCAEGLGVCEKIPIWSNNTMYGVTSDTVGLQETTCLHSDFNIVQCKCQIKLMDIFMQERKECQPYHEVNSTLACSTKDELLPIKQRTSTGTLALRIRMSVSSPQFEITSTPNNTECENPTKLRIWANQEGIHATLGDAAANGAVASASFKNVSGELEIYLLLRQRLMTLAVSRSSVQHVSTVRVSPNALCTDCIHRLSISSASKEDCLLHKISMYNCQPEVTNIYFPS